MKAGSRTGYKITYVYYKEGNAEIYYDGTTWSETYVAPPSGKKSHLIKGSNPSAPTS
jgi:hypothetical protein